MPIRAAKINQNMSSRFTMNRKIYQKSSKSIAHFHFRSRHRNLESLQNLIRKADSAVLENLERLREV